MKQGMTMADLTMQVVSESKAARDFTCPTTKLGFTSYGEREATLRLEMDGPESFRLNSTALGQIREYCGIPSQYWNKCSAHPALMDANVNHWLGYDNKPRLIRCIGDVCRAFLSDRYRRIDNFDILTGIVKVIQDTDVKIASCNIDENHMYLKALSPDMYDIETGKKTDKPEVGDVVRFGFSLRNSEVGLGSAEISPLCMRLVCSNGMIINALGNRRRHVGRNVPADTNEARELYSEETITADDAVFVMKMADTAKAVLAEASVEALLSRMSISKDHKLILNPKDAVEELANKFTFSNAEQDSILFYLCESADMTEWGMANAITRLSHDCQSYERATEMERIGGDVMCGALEELFK